MIVRNLRVNYYLFGLFVYLKTKNNNKKKSLQTINQAENVNI